VQKCQMFFYVDDEYQVSGLDNNSTGNKWINTLSNSWRPCIK